MKKRLLIFLVITFLLLGILLVSPLVLAQEQAQTYSGFDRFLDNVKMFFSFGDKKVMLALDIREKELDSAIMNTKNGDDKEAEKNLERAKEKLQFVQNKVSKDIAEDVKTNIDETISKINEEENLPDNFETYILEEEKTQLTAELVIEVEGKEGQTLTREIVKDGSGENKVEIVVEGGDGQTKVMEITGKIGKIDNEIKERTFAEGTEGIGEPGEDIKTVVVEEGKEVDGDDGLKPVVKTAVAGDGTDVVDDFVDKSEKGGIVGDTGTTVGPVTNQIDGGVGTNQIDSPANDIADPVDDIDSANNVVDGGNDVVDSGGPMDKDNEDVTPEPNVVDDTVDPGPQGIVGSDHE